MYLIAPEQKQYKANLHSHTVISDGKKTPQELKELYKGAGYAILSITDHEIPRNHSDLNDSEFITITGYEAYVRKDPRCISDPYEPEIHMNLFARDPENVTSICFNSNYCKRSTQAEKDAMQKAGSQETREYTVEYINKFIKTAKENGYLVAYNHPHWNMESEETSQSYEGFFSMEMCNYSSYVGNRLEYNGHLYDMLLRQGKRIFCHSADDNHNIHPQDSMLWDSFGGFTMIMSKDFTYASIIEAMETGNMYSSMGPVFKEVSIEDNKVHVECSEVEQIVVHTGSRSPKRAYAPLGGTITSADLEIDRQAKYVRVSIVDKDGKFADTRGYFMDEING